MKSSVLVACPGCGYVGGLVEAFMVTVPAHRNVGFPESRVEAENALIPVGSCHLDMTRVTDGIDTDTSHLQCKHCNGFGNPSNNDGKPVVWDYDVGHKVAATGCTPEEALRVLFKDAGGKLHVSST